MGDGRAMEKKQEYPSGIKWTKQRKSVYEILKEAREPVSAVQIYQQMIRREGQVPYAVSTVYRILSTFEQNGFVTKDTRSEDGNAVYELDRGEHTHYAVCLECHKRIPLKNCPFAHMHLDADTVEFTVTGHKLELYGYCKDCGKNSPQ